MKDGCCSLFFPHTLLYEWSIEHIKSDVFNLRRKCVCSLRANKKTIAFHISFDCLAQKQARARTYLFNSFSSFGSIKFVTCSLAIFIMKLSCFSLLSVISLYAACKFELIMKSCVRRERLWRVKKQSSSLANDDDDIILENNKNFLIVRRVKKVRKFSPSWFHYARCSFGYFRNSLSHSASPCLHLNNIDT